MKTKQEIDDIINFYTIRLKFTSNSKKISELLTDFMLRIGQSEPDKDELRKELIRMLDNKQVQYTYGVLDNVQVVNNYLKSKLKP